MKRNKYRAIYAARRLRRDLTPAEQLLWKFLRDRSLCRFKFRRQYPLEGFVIDFFCPEERLAVEIDGEIHNKQKEPDRQRQEMLEGKGISFLRFKNDDVLNDLESVLRTIKRKASPLHKVERGVPISLSLYSNVFRDPDRSIGTGVRNAF